MDLLPPEEISPEAVHPALWRASQVGRSGAAVIASGFTDLDIVLPGGGWPTGALSELLLPHPGVGEMRLLAPALLALQVRGLMWFDPPALPCAEALQALGIELESLVLVQSRPASYGAAGAGPRSATPRASGPHLGSRHVGSGGPVGSAQPSDALWALELALKSGHVGAVLAWLPAKVPADALRRLQLAAQSHEGPVFLLRPEEAAAHASPAQLRLVLGSAAPDWLRVTLLKRRGPPVTQPLLLPLTPVLSAPSQARARASAALAPTGEIAAVQGRPTPLPGELSGDLSAARHRGLDQRA